MKISIKNSNIIFSIHYVINLIFKNVIHFYENESVPLLLYSVSVVFRDKVGSVGGVELEEVPHLVQGLILGDLGSTVYSIQCTVYSAQCTVYSVQCTVYSIQCTVHYICFMFKKNY